MLSDSTYPVRNDETTLAECAALSSAPKMSRDELVALGLPIVRRLAFNFARRVPPNVEVGDLMGAGAEGLLKAVATYSDGFAARFETYAELRIRGAILDELRGCDAMTRYGRQRYTQVSRTIARLETKLGRAPDEQEVADALKMSLEQYQKHVKEFAAGPALGRLGEVDPDAVASGVEVESDCDRRRAAERLSTAIAGLPERMQTVLGLYYQEDCTQSEIGQVLGISESRVCQILAHATERLRIILSSHRDAA